MSIADYSDLVGAVTEYSGRDDFAHMIPRFVSFLENKLNRRLRVGDMELSDTVTTDTDGKVALPADYLEMRELVNATGKPLESRPLIALDDTFRFRSGTPEGYAVIGTTLYVAPITAAEFLITYYQKIPALTVTNTSNWLLADHPNVYLYGLLAEVHGWAAASGRDPEGATKAAAAAQMMGTELDALESLDRSQRYSNSRMMLRGVTP